MYNSNYSYVSFDLDFYSSEREEGNDGGGSSSNDEMSRTCKVFNVVFRPGCACCVDPHFGIAGLVRIPGALGRETVVTAWRTVAVKAGEEPVACDVVLVCIRGVAAAPDLVEARVPGASLGERRLTGKIGTRRRTGEVLTFEASGYIAGLGERPA